VEGEDGDAYFELVGKQVALVGELAVEAEEPLLFGAEGLVRVVGFVGFSDQSLGFELTLMSTLFC